MTWRGGATPWMTVNGDEMAAVNGEFLPENVEGNDETKGMLNSGGVTTAVNGEEKSMLMWLLDNDSGNLTTVNGDGELTAETKDMLRRHINNNGGLMTETTTVNGDRYSSVNGLLTCQLQANEFKGDSEVVTGDEEHADVVKCRHKRYGDVSVTETEFVTDEMLTWQNKEEDEEELSKFLDEALKLCGSSFYDSDTSYMAGISGVWSGVADEAHEEMEVEWGECEDKRSLTWSSSRKSSISINVDISFVFNQH
nr:hypothetical protein [Tanacetum cinerariifolium]